jgi:hypothetical protein
MVRLVFRPFTQVWRTICTSVPLRAFTRVSPGFTLLRRSSPSFGSYQICSCSSPLSETPGRLLLNQLILSFLMRSGFSTLTLAYWIDSLVRVSRRDGKSHFDKIARRPLRLPSSFSNHLHQRIDRAFGQTTPGKKPHFASCIRKHAASCNVGGRQPMKYKTSPKSASTRCDRTQMITLLPLSSQRFQVF